MITVLELINKLEALRLEHGDLPVQAYTTTEAGDEVVIDVDGAEWNDDGEEIVILITGEERT